MTLPRVLSYPPRHPYVDRLHGRAARLVHRQAEMPRVSQFYDLSWIDDHAHDFDIAHLHFGHEQYRIDHVLEVIAAHREREVPVVLTVHDLQIPHLGPADPYARDLATAAGPMVDALLTLTPGCAAAVRSLTGRSVTIVPHGPVIPAARRRQLRARHTEGAPAGRSWLLLAGRLRPNLGWHEVVQAYRAVSPVRRLRIQVHRTCAQEVRRATRHAPGIDVVSHDRLTHAQLEELVADAAALLLPYRWGTHSGLLELAADTATPTVVTDAGFLAQQHPSVCIPVIGSRRVAHERLGEVFDNDSAVKSPALISGEAGRRQDATTFQRHHRHLYRALRESGCRS